MDSNSQNEKLPLVQAARQGQRDTIESLLSQGAAINERDKDGKTALTHAAFNGRIETVKLLLKNDAAINLKDHYGGTPLFWAVCGAYFDIVKLLTDHGADISAQDNQGRSPFMRAASGVSRPAHIDIMKLFLDLGTDDVNQADNHGVTALMTAAGGGYVEITKMLM